MPSVKIIVEVELSELPNFDSVHITEVGEENMYFTHEDAFYFCKVA